MRSFEGYVVKKEKNRMEKLTAEHDIYIPEDAAKRDDRFMVCQVVVPMTTRHDDIPIVEKGEYIVVRSNLMEEVEFVMSGEQMKLHYVPYNAIVLELD